MTTNDTTTRLIDLRQSLAVSATEDDFELLRQRYQEKLLMYDGDGSRKEEGWIVVMDAVYPVDGYSSC